MKISEDLKSRIAYITACVSEFAKRKNMDTQAAYIYLSDHGGIQFLKEHYDIEHTLSFDEAVDDLEAIGAQNRGDL